MINQQVKVVCLTHLLPGKAVRNCIQRDPRPRSSLHSFTIFIPCSRFGPGFQAGAN